MHATRRIHLLSCLAIAISTFGHAQAGAAEGPGTPTLADCAATAGSRDPAVMQMIEGLRGKETNDRQSAAKALVDRGAPAVRLSLCLLTDEDPGVRAAGARALGAIRSAEALDPLVAALSDPTPDVREEAAKALGALGSAKAVDALIAALRDATLDVRAQAAAALGLIRDVRAVDPLVRLLSEKSPYDESRIGARVVFAEDSGAKVGAVLDGGYNMLGLDLAHTAAVALETITGEKIGQQPADWNAWLRKRAGSGRR